MLPTSFNIGQFLSAQRLILLVAALFFTLPVYAADTITAQEMLKNIVSQLPQVMKMITAMAYVMGFYFIFYGIMKLKQYGEARTQMSQSHELKGPLIFMMVGALLIYLPSSVEIGMSTFWSNPSPYGYLEKTDQWSELLNSCIMIVQVFGTIAFIRGLVILTHLGGHGQPGVFAKGMTHIVGGILCINIYQFVQVILITLGI